MRNINIHFLVIFFVVFISCNTSQEEITNKGCECYSYPKNSDSEEACDEYETMLKQTSITQEEKLEIVVAVNSCILEMDKKVAKETDKAAENVLDNPDQIKMPTTNPTVDSLDQVIELEDFDPNDI